MYKKASRLKLRFQTKKGLLSVEQLWDLNMSELADLIRQYHKLIESNNDKSDDLEFLKEDSDKSATESIDSLKFDILKDIYMTKKQESAEKLKSKEKAEYRAKIMEIISRKQDQDLESKSIDELTKLLNETK